MYRYQIFINLKNNKKQITSKSIDKYLFHFDNDELDIVSGSFFLNIITAL